MGELQTALAAAHGAGAILRERWPEEREVRFKGYRDIVTEADTAAQAAIIARLREDFPDYSILAEEGEPIRGAGDLCPTWVVDPLDGTTNYARRLPTWGVAIGLLSGADLRVGVVYDPLRDVTYYAERGRGAFRLPSLTAAPEPLQVSQATALANSVVGLDLAHEDEARGRVLDAQRAVALACGSVRIIGSAALGICSVAAGAIEAYFHFGLKPWDVAGPALIVAEAGGQITSPDGGRWALGLPQVVLSNGRIHGELLETMRGSP